MLLLNVTEKIFSLNLKQVFCDKTTDLLKQCSGLQSEQHKCSRILFLGARNVLVAWIVNWKISLDFETYTRYFKCDDEEQKKRP